MPDSEGQGDRDAIRAIIISQFESLSWGEGHAPGWDGFAGDFLAEASLFPAARPAKPIGVGAFVERMRKLSETSLRTFDETVLGIDIHVFGNIAIAAAGAEMIENGAGTSRSVEMMLLVKSEGSWKIAAQAWDKASESNPLPDTLVSAATSR
ncbi:hypothetical protein LGH82_26885 [Mesorhizobium sp. PAMC28654]|uniref:hypothetical protein n=1 Tax=Mesorhizobium sp. PAMC28654 TaxID=2880934 RepID=UPI001D0A017F|nr:hypothetical protein [Mesorhizobium sp. PAMC28654]UDL88709.1 hypothetical protein LGH82_26885 [Mesorhizobium sp. PAMC28654]